MNNATRRIAEGIFFTDQYQLTMAQLYFRAGLHEREVQFDHFFRRYPDYGSHQAGYCINAGLESVLDWMAEAHFGEEEAAYLASRRNQAGERIFHDDFLAWLRANGDFSSLSLHAIPEGRVVHPNAPLTVVRGPLAMAQIVETGLLNYLNYQTLVATKAARMLEASRNGSILEFGLRRAQGRGAIEGSRAAVIGGAVGTSNVGAAYAMGITPMGTHAHSMVQMFMALGMGELAAFEAYADLYPDNCLLLVDTIDTLESGVPNAITVFEQLRAKGRKPVGIRLDSGDQAYLAIQAAKQLNEAGFADTSIVLSSDLDELVIWQINTQILHEAPRYGLEPQQVIDRLVYGVGTRLITSWGEPALGGVYKLVAVNQGGDWKSAIKISETPAKTPNPGLKGLWRIYDQRGYATADVLSLIDEQPQEAKAMILRHPMDHTKYRALANHDIAEIEPLHVEVLREGKRVYELPSLEEICLLRRADVKRLDPGVRRLVNPHIYHVSLTQALWDMKQDLIDEAEAPKN
ncbi:MAG: nicotinate phosphoribosyltransferase [Caldilineaceae bacterium]|nr:nicotinate phosphoribosyltransferase [Caldilineaceae bacterium]MCB9136815.1 nicotinate phosphoribosyltransferase [Caldilineaceae bacterium]